jgi:predicted anti-sigma-YlaC factor YlaD
MDAEVNSGACSEFEAKLEDYLSGQLSGTDTREVQEHLAQCSACRTAVEEAASATRLLAVAEPTADPGPGFARIAMARIRTEVATAEEAAKGFWQPFVALAWRFAATVAIALVVMVGYEVGRQHREPAETAVAEARANDMRYMFTADADRVPSNRDDVLIMVAEAKHGNR